ncbi:MAG TPA: beta-propeller fold lactonase family protein [Pseudonocardia sp.]
MAERPASGLRAELMRLSDLDVGPPLSQGGQGTIHVVLDAPERVLKRFHEAELARASDLEERLRAMVALRPAGWREASGHTMLAWPSDVVLDGSRFVGHVMPRLRLADVVELHVLANPSDRSDPRSATPGWVRGFTWRHLVRTGANLALAIDVLHRSDYVVGDFNERNVLVRFDTRVTLVDCDSMQVPNPRSGPPFLCGVGRAEFTAPELLDVDLATTPRRASSDLFALAVHVFQLLMEGVHPFDGVWHGDGEKPRRHQLARHGLFAYAGDPRLRPRPSAMPFDLLPQEIRELFTRAFVLGAADPDARPTGREWHDALGRCAADLRTCAAAERHVYPAHHAHCPWCAQDLRAQDLRAQERRRAAAAAVAPPPAPADRRRRVRGGVVLAALAVVDALLAVFLIAQRPPTLTQVAVARVAGPAAMAVSPDDRHLYVAGACCAVSVIDPATGAVTATIPTRHGAAGLAVSPDGAHLYATDSTSGTVSVIDVAANAVTATVSVGPDPLGVAVSPDGRALYVAEDSDPGTVAVLDAATAAVTRTIAVGGNPAAVAVTPDGRAAYVTNDAANTVSVLDADTGAVIAAVPVGQYPGAGQYPQAVTISPDGRYAYVASPQIGAVTVLDTSSLTPAARLPSSGFMVVAPGARHAYLVGGGVSVVDTTTNTVTRTVPTTLRPDFGAVSRDGRRLYLADAADGTVTIVDTGGL